MAVKGKKRIIFFEYKGDFWRAREKAMFWSMLILHLRSIAHQDVRFAIVAKSACFTCLQSPVEALIRRSSEDGFGSLMGTNSERPSPSGAAVQQPTAQPQQTPVLGFSAAQGPSPTPPLTTASSPLVLGSPLLRPGGEGPIYTAQTPALGSGTPAHAKHLQIFIPGSHFKEQVHAVPQDTAELVSITTASFNLNFSS